MRLFLVYDIVIAFLATSCQHYTVVWKCRKLFRIGYTYNVTGFQKPGPVL